MEIVAIFWIDIELIKRINLSKRIPFPFKIEMRSFRIVEW